ncbi:MAG: ABC transporter ATP-binding protein [Frankia sp.]|nr:ABC transporter ATP-binding protein [Frankia sp.]
MLRVESLTVHHGPVAAVVDLDLEVREGEAVALLGANGAGKSSTLAAISRLIPAVSGAVHLDGRPLGRRAADQVARLGLLHVPEGRRVFPTLTVHENLQVASAARRRRGGGPRATRALLDEVYDLFPMLTPLRDRPGWALSGGEAQMVAIGRALMGAPRVLLLDEPSLGLAPAVVDAVYGALARIRERVPLLLVEQDTTRALNLCDRAYVLRGGRLAMTGTAAELRDAPDLVAAYLT